MLVMAYEAVLGDQTPHLERNAVWLNKIRQLLKKAQTIFLTKEKVETPPALFFQDLTAADQEKLENKVREIRSRPSPMSTSAFEVGDVVVSQASLINYQVNPFNQLLTTRVKAVFPNFVTLTDSNFPTSQSYFYAKFNSLTSIFSLRILSQEDIQLIQDLKPVNHAASFARADKS